MPMLDTILYICLQTPYRNTRIHPLMLLTNHHIFLFFSSLPIILTWTPLIFNIDEEPESQQSQGHTLFYLRAGHYICFSLYKCNRYPSVKAAVRKIQIFNPQNLFIFQLEACTIWPKFSYSPAPGNNHSPMLIIIDNNTVLCIIL